MITRALLLALACAHATALSPLTVAGDDSDCALYLSGPGRTSAYDYSINLLKGNFGYEGQHTCITYDAINQAYLEARNRILVSQPKGDWKPEDYASVGELVLDISINLARRYGLTYEEVEKGLPLIDTSRTLIREVCPPVFSHVECRAGKYRRLDGLCNNLQHPTWGSTNSPFQRLIGPLFSDGINAPRISHTGRDLPLSRVVSRTMHPDDGFHDHAGTVMVIAWGQFMDHDYTLTGTPLDPINRNDPEECCKRPPHLKHPYCNEIRIPDDDYFYRLFGVKCIDFVRGFPSPRPGCRLGSRIPFNTLTGVIDGNTVYGVTEKFARKLRTGFGGLLRMNPVFKEYGLKDLLPLKLDIPDEGCTRPNKNMYCFEAGEIRVNEQLILTVMHTLMAREHNRVARALADVNPHWDDETLYQEARRINIAEIQHITYNEFLPILLGKDVMEKFGLVLEKEGYWDGYDPEVNPDVIASFAAAAYRFGHSLLPTAVERWSKAHKFIASKRLSDLIRRPYDLYRAGVLDEYVMGLMNQVAQAMDDSITQEVTNHLFKKVGARFGMDLVSFNMQRGREFGLPGYMEFRKFCGLPGADSFQDLFGTMSNETVRKYETIFEHPVDVDLWSGGVSERPLPGSMLGPTFACIIATQFSYSRRGDRFWFELPKQPSSFTSEQMVEIRKSRLARIICDNTDIIDTVQLYPMVLPDHELNPRVPCRSGIIPMMDFSKWAEPVPFQGPAKQFITDAIITSNNDTNATEVATDANVVINNMTEICVDCNITINLKCNCNDTTDSTSNTQNQTEDLNIQHKLKCDCLNNNVDLTVKKFEDNSPTAPTETAEITNEVPNSNTVYQYVYNKNGDIATKSKGHFKNSLNRRRRSSDAPNSRQNTGYRKNAPAIVNYETSHKPRNIEIVSPFRSANTIRNADLADFNVETLHDSAKNVKNVQELPVDYTNDHKKQRQSSEESIERDDYNRIKENPRNYKDSGESAERNEYKQTDDINDRDSHENNQYKQHHKAIPEGSTESRESNERYYDENNNLPYNKPQHESLESGEKIYNRGPKISHGFPTPGKQSRPENSLQESGEYSNESTEKQYKFSQRDHDNYKNDQKNTTSPKIVDIDLGDFSYERLKVNEKGEVQATEDSNENYDNNSSAELTNITTSKPDTKFENYDEGRSLPKEITDSSSSIEVNNESAELIHINDGEVKPVVELNSDSGDSEENINDALKINANDQNQSLESLLGVKETESNEHNDKLVASKNVQDNGDVKQQFERIPLNYNHSEKNQKPNTEDAKPKAVEDDDSGTNNEGTLDTFSPPEYRYDENLNIKFDDLTIKLPEIKLPDDILAYDYDVPAYGHEKDNAAEKQNFYNYNDERSAEQVRQKDNAKKNNEEADPGYYGHYGNYQEKENYKKKPNEEEEEEGDDEEEERDDEEEDLYEKFVRERFGKRGSFEKRTENLQDSRALPKNPELYKTIQNILKKTEEVQKQAEKSGDPKAGYMWTLEYGENA